MASMRNRIWYINQRKEFLDRKIRKLGAMSIAFKELAEMIWSEPLRVDNELSDINPWRGADEENKATL
jgi:hypothetical protein